MGTATVDKNGESHYHALTDYVQRGDLYAALSNDGQSVWVYYGSPLGYPTGETFAHIPVAQIPNLIAALTAVVHTK